MLYNAPIANYMSLYLVEVSTGIVTHNKKLHYAASYSYSHQLDLHAIDNSTMFLSFYLNYTNLAYCLKVNTNGDLIDAYKRNPSIMNKLGRYSING